MRRLIATFKYLLLRQLKCCASCRVRSPGFGMTLCAESMDGFILTSDVCSNPRGEKTLSSPEEIGRKGAHLLLEEIYRVSFYTVLQVLHFSFRSSSFSVVVSLMNKAW